jgi:hypothetical protein
MFLRSGGNPAAPQFVWESDGTPIINYQATT